MSSLLQPRSRSAGAVTGVVSGWGRTYPGQCIVVSNTCDGVEMLPGGPTSTLLQSTSVAVLSPGECGAR